MSIDSYDANTDSLSGRRAALQYLADPWEHSPEGSVAHIVLALIDEEPERVSATDIRRIMVFPDEEEDKSWGGWL